MQFRITKTQTAYIDQVRRFCQLYRWGKSEVCEDVSEELERAFGWELVRGDYLGPSNPTNYHCWNKLPNGDILDATADQFGLDPVMWLGPEDPIADLYLPRLVQPEERLLAYFKQYLPDVKRRHPNLELVRCRAVKQLCVL